MKKLLSIIVLSVLLLGMAGSAVLAVGEGDACCPAAGLDCDTGLNCVGAIVDPADPTACITTGECRIGSGGPLQTIRESCTLSSQVTWKKGNIDGSSSSDCAATACVLDEGKTVGPITHASAEYKTNQWGVICLVNSMTTVTNWIFYLMMVFVVVMIVIGGAVYMLAAGNPEKAGKGKSIIIYGIIGLVIALIARLIPSVVRLIVGMG